MREIGKILHVAGSGRVIIQISEPLPEGQILCDKGGTRVARVMELIGPVSSPFASAAALTNSIKKHVGRAVFAGQEQYEKRESQAFAQKTRRRRTR
ncbi:MAG: Gar1/Naf1 family protein [Thaumarchaeota archaeon]|nr:Gar1/Naf1 family protein [Nitrososphaerota archaeon]